MKNLLWSTSRRSGRYSKQGLGFVLSQWRTAATCGSCEPIAAGEPACVRPHDDVTVPGLGRQL